MSAPVYVPLIRHFPSFLALDNFLGEPKGELINKIPMIVGEEEISMEEVVTIIQKLSKNRWSLPESEIDAGIGIVEKVQRCYEPIAPPLSHSWCCIDFFWQRNDTLRLSLSSAKTKLRHVKELYEYTTKPRPRDTYIRPFESGLSRAIHIDPEGQVIVHLNRKSNGDSILGKGAEKVVTNAYVLGTTKAFATAGFKALNPKEFQFLRLFKGIPGFAQLKGFFKYKKNGEEKYRAVFELCRGGELFDAFDKGLLTRRDRKKIFIELIENVALMHRMGCLHRDLKIENILLEPEEDGLKPIIVDFGSARKLNDLKARTDNHPFTTRYITPEYARACLLRGKQREKSIEEADNVSLDSWALGLILNVVLYMPPPPWLTATNSQAIILLSKIENEKWMNEPQAKNSPEHLVWEMLQNRLLVSEAEKKLPNIDWSAYQ